MGYSQRQLWTACCRLCKRSQNRFTVWSVGKGAMYPRLQKLKRHWRKVHA